jgi:hypothetical protein
LKCHSGVSTEYEQFFYILLDIHPITDHFPNELRCTAVELNNVPRVLFLELLNKYNKFAQTAIRRGF